MHWQHILKQEPVRQAGQQHVPADRLHRQQSHLAKLCFDTLMAEGVKAKLALEAGASTPAVEKVIEATHY